MRRIAPAYERITFDKEVVTRPRHGEEERNLPQAELCGPGHPLFDAVVGHAITATRADVERGAVLYDPDAGQPAILRFLSFDVVDGNGDIVRRVFAAAREQLRRPRRARAVILAVRLRPRGRDNGIEPRSPEVAPQHEDLLTWSRQHLFEQPFADARRRASGVADIQADFVRRSFDALLIGADEAALAAEDELDRGVARRRGTIAQGRAPEGDLPHPL